ISSFIFIFLLLTLRSASAAGNELKLYHEANMSYQKQDYESAIRQYEDLIKLGAKSSEVYFNLGNSYFKTGNIGKTILNYERAKKLNPADEDIDFNIKIASLKVVDKIEPVPEIFYQRWLNSVSSLLSPDTWSQILSAMVWLIFIAATF